MARSRHGFTFLLCVTGRLVLRCGVVDMSLDAGQATVFADAISTELQVDGSSQIVALRFEDDAAKAYQPTMDRSGLRAVAIDLAAAALFLNYCNILATSGDRLSPPCANLAIAQLRELAALMLNPSTEAARKLSFGGPKAARLRAVLHDVAANLRDPELNAAKVGARLGLTQRYVQILMEGFGKSFSKHVREMRLDEAKRMLRDAALDHLRITDIAYAVGFQDISYFNRAFRNRYGARPSAVRGGS
jgi:AraC-like DNA-binding protein